MAKNEEPTKSDKEELNTTQEVSLSTAEKIEYVLITYQETAKRKKIG
jgi:hypothetical protein